MEKTNTTMEEIQKSNQMREIREEERRRQEAEDRAVERNAFLEALKTMGNNK